ncbi:MAG: hypothetical protein LBE82_07245 [Chitinophagaceae bacterium]|jgi:hypothetical protein|nr:hypothetical protein [Chitinophagaceae bacterium]
MNTAQIQQPTALRIIAKIFSYLFHPLFVPTYIFLWMMLRFPYEFAGITIKVLNLRLFGVFWFTAFFPALSVFLLWRLKFIPNIFLHTTKERIIPYVITMFFYWWMWYLSRDKTFADQPEALRFFYLGIFFTTVPGLILNNFVKISMHAMAIGVAVACMILTSRFYAIYLGLDIILVMLVGGMTLTSRLILSEHTNAEMYLGVVVGVFCQVLAYWITMN